MTELFFSRNAANSFKFARTTPLNLNTCGSNVSSNTVFEGNDVLVIELNLDLGSLSVIKEQNEDLWEYPRKGYSKKELKCLWNIGSEAILKLRSVKKNDTVRIWWSDIASEICGFYYSMSLLWESECSIISVKMPFLNKMTNADIIYNWGTQMIEPEEWNTLLDNERIITPNECKKIAHYWESLENTDSPVRIQLNGNLLGVDENFYDSFILDCFNKCESGTIKELMIKLSQMGFCLPDWWIANRLTQLKVLD